MRFSFLPFLFAGCTAVMSLQSCGTNNPPPTAGTSQTGSPKEGNAQALPKLNYYFYLETSASMDAYLAPGNTRFRSAVNELQAFLNTQPSRQSFHIREVADKAYDVFPDATDAQVASYFGDLGPAAVSKHAAAAKASRTASDLSQVIATVLEKTGPNDVSVLVSDCVVDTKANGSNLASQQSAVQTMVSRRLGKSLLSALVLRDTTEFRNGTYYPPAGGSEKISGYRPYFLIVLGPPVAIQQLATRLLAKENFIAQSALLGPPIPSPATALLPPLGGLDYYAADPESVKNLIAKKARLSGPGKNFVLRFETNLSQVSATEAYKTNPANYEVSPAQYQLEIGAQPHGAYTHVFTLTSPTLGAGHSVTIKLKNKLPDWIEKYSSTYAGFLKNQPAEMDKTYGLQYLMKGFAAGFNGTGFLFEMKPVQVAR